MAKKESAEEEALVHHLKKRKRVRFVATDEGVEANNCIKVYLVSHKEQVDSSEVIPVDTVDLNVFFEDDGKIYGYQGLKITIWINSLSFSVYVDISFQSSSDKGKGITDLKSALQEILGDNLVDKKEDFLHSFEDEVDYISSLVSTGEVLRKKIFSGRDVDSKGQSEVEEASTVEVVHIRLGNNSAGSLYCRLVPLVLLLIDGSNPIDIEDPEWEMFVLMLSKPDTRTSLLLGFATVYRFYHYPDSWRLRLGQILVLPQYQHRGYGRLLLETLNGYAEGSEKVYDLTMEEPLENLQHLRTCIDTRRLLELPAVILELDSAISRIENEGPVGARMTPGRDTVEDVRRRTKINQKQFIQCWDVLLCIRYKAGPGRAESFRDWVSERVRADVVGKCSGSNGKRVIDLPTQHDHHMNFVMFGYGGAHEAVPEEQEEQIQLAVTERVREIEHVAKKVLVQT